MNSVIQKDVVHRSAESGRVICHWAGVSVISHGTAVVDFRDLEIGTCFKMIAGKWLMRKVSEAGAIRCDATVGTKPGYSTFDFEGWERCYVIQQTEAECVPSSQCASL